MESEKVTDSKTATLGDNKDDASREEGSLKATVADGSKFAISGVDGFKPVFRTFQFTLDFNVFNSLVETVYRRISMDQPDYSANISMGMFSYYCGIALWYRLYAVKHAQGRDPGWSFSVMKISVEDGFILPNPICEFLDLVGDFLEPNQNFYWQLDFPNLNADGHFGKMAAESFNKYMAYPAPAVLVETLRRELDMINGKIEIYSEWRLKDIDYENIDVKKVFTKNVCGYYVPPNASMFTMKVDDNIGEQLSKTFATKVPQKINGLLLYNDLMTYITNYNSNNISKYPVKEYKNESQYGSVAQMGFVTSSTTDAVGNRGEYFSNDLQAFSQFLLPPSVADLILVFRLRVKRSSNINAYPYDFLTTKEIPADWPKSFELVFCFWRR